MYVKCWGLNMDSLVCNMDCIDYTVEHGKSIQSSLKKEFLIKIF